MYSIWRHGQCVDMRMTATLENIDEAARDVKSFFVSLGLGQECFPVVLGLREALLNAVIHGSGQDRNKYVIATLVVGQDDLCLFVEDQGPGFNWRDRSPGAPCPHETSGRGVAILNEYFPCVRYNETGNRVELRKPLKGGVMSDIRRDGNSAVIMPGSDIVASMAEPLRQELKKLMDSGVEDITIDFTGVEMLDSMGIGLLIAAHNSLSQKGAKLKVANAGKDILGLLGTMRLNMHFEILA